MTKNIKPIRGLSLACIASALILCFQNCGPAFNTMEGSLDNASTSTGGGGGGAPMPTATPGPNQVLVTVGVGVGGRLVAGLDGFATILSEYQKFSSVYNNIVINTANIDATVCPAPTVLLPYVYLKACCFDNNNRHCATGGYHSDFLYRAVAFGNGRFVAVGGASFAVVQVSTDGLQWSQKYDLTPDTGLVTGNRNATGWLAGIAYGNGRFVAAAGDGSLYVSTDGQNWVSSSIKKPASTVRAVTFVGDRFYATGENGAWGVTIDGTEWTSLGVSVSITSPIKVGSMYYGVSNNWIYQTNDLSTGNWTQVYNATGADCIAYDPVAKVLVAVGGNRVHKSDQAFTNWQTQTFANLSGRYFHFNGKQFVGAGGPAIYSSDGIHWAKAASDPMFDQPFTSFASGYITQ